LTIRIGTGSFIVQCEEFCFATLY